MNRRGFLGSILGSAIAPAALLVETSEAAQLITQIEANTNADYANTIDAQFRATVEARDRLNAYYGVGRA